MIVETLGRRLFKARTTNYTTNGYPTRIPTLAAPSLDDATATGQAAINLLPEQPDGVVPNAILILPYGLDASVNNKTMSMRVIGWRKIGTGGTSLWIPVPLVEVACTLSGTQVGIAGATLVATEAFADTITLTGTTANANVGVELVSPANDTVGHVVVDLKGFKFVEPVFTTGGSATSCNALCALI